MDRFRLIKNTIFSHSYTSYVEIGVYRGRSFLPVKCWKKIAIDPYMKISWKGKLYGIYKNMYNINSKYYNLTSDNFFRNKAPKILGAGKIDLFFIDGLHTFEASLKDVLNSLKYLNKNGTIIMHDCFPPHKAAATPAASFQDAKKMNVNGWTGQWCGDVWKTIVYLKEKYPLNLNVAVLNSDFGLGIISFTTPIKSKLEIDEDLFKRIESLTYESVFSNPEKTLGLREAKEFDLK